MYEDVESCMCRYVAIGSAQFFVPKCFARRPGTVRSNLAGEYLPGWHTELATVGQGDQDTTDIEADLPSERTGPSQPVVRLLP